MRAYSIAEFDSFCSRLHPHTYTYSDENQDDAMKESALMTAQFDDLTVSLHPCCFFFRGKACSLRLSRVKKIYVHTSDPAIGTIFTVICEGGSDGKQETSYTMIAE